MAVKPPHAKGSTELDPLTVAREFFEVFGGGPLPAWDEFAHAVSPEYYPAGKVIFDVDEEHPFVYVVLRGAVKIVASDAAGSNHLVGLARAGELVASIQALAPAGLGHFVDQDLLGAGWSAGAAIPPSAGAAGAAWSSAGAPGFILSSFMYTLLYVYVTSPLYCLWCCKDS